jgi:hypothetical protein
MRDVAFGGTADVAAKLLTRDDARRIAANIAKLALAPPLKQQRVRVEGAREAA